MVDKYKLLSICVILIIVIAVIVSLYFIIRVALQNAAMYEKAGKKCEQYKKLACKYRLMQNKTQSSVFAGEYASEGSLPHMAFIINPTTRYTCAGTLISENFILTNAHCVNCSNLSIKLGSSTSKTNDSGEWFRATAVYQHPLYINKPTVYDLGLIKLDKTVKFSSYIRPICLYTELDVEDGNITASGWSLDTSGEPFQRLRVVDIRIKSERVESACEQKLGISPVDYTTGICAGHEVKNENACPGGTGGPLQTASKGECPNTYEQIGITAHDGFFEMCEGNPNGIVLVGYTRIFALIPWIVENVWPED